MECKYFQAELKSGKKYYGKLQVDETSGKIKSNQKLPFSLPVRLRISPSDIFYKKVFGKSGDWVLF